MSGARIIRNVVVALSIPIGLIGCGDDHNPAPTIPSTHWIVAVDLSASLNATQLKESKEFVMGLADAARNGDAVTMFRVYERGLADSNYMWETELAPAPDPANPRASDSLALIDFKDELTAEVDVVFDPRLLGRLLGTDLFSTAYRAADIAKADPKREKVFILVSDMLQSTSRLDMERSVPDTSWVTKAHINQALPDLPEVCVAVVGANPTTQRGARVRAFWSRYFEASGADLRIDNYRNYAKSPAGMDCQSSGASTAVSVRR